MAMRDVVGSATALIGAQLTADLAALGWPAPALTFGAASDYFHGAPPAIVWVPTRDRFDFTPVSYRPPSTATQKLRPLRTCWMGFEARLWATFSNLPVASRPAVEDYSATEALRDQLIAALQKVAGGFFELGDGTWTDVRGGEDLLLGRGYTLQVWIARPVFDLVQAAQMAQLATLPISRQLGPTVDPPSPQSIP